MNILNNNNEQKILYVRYKKIFLQKIKLTSQSQKNVII